MEPKVLIESGEKVATAMAPSRGQLVDVAEIHIHHTEILPSALVIYGEVMLTDKEGWPVLRSEIWHLTTPHQDPCLETFPLH